MALITQFELIAKEANGEALSAFLSEILPGTLSYEGCEGADFGVSEDNASSVLLIEKWRSKADFEAYLNWRIDRGDFAKMQSLLALDPKVQYFNLTA